MASLGYVFSSCVCFKAMSGCRRLNLAVCTMSTDCLGILKGFLLSVEGRLGLH